MASGLPCVARELARTGGLDDRQTGLLTEAPVPME